MVAKSKNKKKRLPPRRKRMKRAGRLQSARTWLAIVATTVAFFRCSKVAGWLMVPYLSWVSFASVLNFTIWHLIAG